LSEIHPITPPYFVIRPGKINKDDKSPDKQKQGKKKSVLKEQAAKPNQHIDEIV